MTLTKDRVIDRIHKNTHLLKVESARTLQSLKEIMKQTLSSGENILISAASGNSVSRKRKSKGAEIPRQETILRWEPEEWLSSSARGN